MSNAKFFRNTITAVYKTQSWVVLMRKKIMHTLSFSAHARRNFGKKSQIRRRQYFTLSQKRRMALSAHPQNAQWNDRHSGQISLPGGKRWHRCRFCRNRHPWNLGRNRRYHLKSKSWENPLFIFRRVIFRVCFSVLHRKLARFQPSTNQVQEIFKVPLSVIRNLPKPPQTMELPKPMDKVPIFWISKPQNLGPLLWFWVNWTNLLKKCLNLPVFWCLINYFLNHKKLQRKAWK